MERPLLACAASLLLTSLAGTPGGSTGALAQGLAHSVIDFEPDSEGRLPDGGTPEDEGRVFDQYLASHGVEFGADTNGDGYPDAGGPAPSFERTGGLDNENGFINDALGLPDTAWHRLEAELGNWFLDLDLDNRNTALLITYVHPVLGAAGQIWDIDGVPNLGYEQWQVVGLDESRNRLVQSESPLGSTLGLDGKPWNWRIEAPIGQSISAIRIDFTGQKSRVGMAFDRFTPSLTTPTPTSSPTASPTPTPTVAATATAAATASPTATLDLPRFVYYFPVALNEVYRPRKAPIDVVLVLDASSSMAGAKFRGAKQAATDFIISTNLPRDHVGMVAFNDRAYDIHPLSGDLNSLLIGLGEAPWSPGTRIDLGLEAAVRMFDEGGRGDAIPVVVLLSRAPPRTSCRGRRASPPEWRER